MKIEIGISDTRNIMGFLTDLKGYDFSNYSVVLIKHRIELFMTNRSCTSVSFLLELLTDSSSLLNDFIHCLACESTEMFRDPSFWIMLKDNILPKIFQSNSTPVFWVPACVSGDELFSLCSLLNTYATDNSYTINAGYYTDYTISHENLSVLSQAKVEVSIENAKVVFNQDFDSLIKNNELRNRQWIETVQFSKCRLSGFDISEQKADFILCRNRLLNYTSNSHQRIIQTFHKSLNENGFLAVGIKEHVETNFPSKYFKAVSELECVYQKIN